jgi:hypothetical protein
MLLDFFIYFFLMEIYRLNAMVDNDDDDDRPDGGEFVVRRRLQCLPRVEQNWLRW